jgi:hypothetical protein
MEPDVAGELLSVVEAASEALRRIGDSEASLRGAPGTWSKKEILGHLLDSAVNNHHRFVRAQQVEELTFPAYAQEHWVRSQGYGERPWSVLSFKAMHLAVHARQEHRRASDQQRAMTLERLGVCHVEQASNVGVLSVIECEQPIAALNIED